LTKTEDLFAKTRDWSTKAEDYLAKSEAPKSVENRGEGRAGAWELELPH
jgi:hypothetical protein